MSSQIESKILAATKQKPIGEGEKFQDYLARLAKSVSDLPDAGWASIGEAGQDWYNAAAQAIIDKKPIQNFPDETGRDETPTATPAAAPARIRATPKAAQPAAAPAATSEATPASSPAAASAETKPAAEPKVKGAKGGVKALKKLIFANPNHSKDQIKSAFAAISTQEGYIVNPSTFESVVYDTTQSITLLREMGLWGGQAAAPAKAVA